MNAVPASPVSVEPDRVSWLRRAALSLAAVFVVAGLGFAPAASAQDSSTTEAPSTETVPAGAKAAVESPPRELTTGEVDDDSLYIIEEYRIDGDKILPNGDTPIPALTQKVWDRFANLFPAASRPEIDLLVGIGQEGSNGTDGALQTSALDPSKRYMALDVSGAVEFKELTRTMIHEYAHLLQFRPRRCRRAPRATHATCMTVVSVPRRVRTCGSGTKRSTPGSPTVRTTRPKKPTSWLATAPTST
ncbi:MAG: hypothetical protein R2754_18765 [Microthrixaceae bacterium]